MFSKIFTNYSTVKLGVLVWKYKFLSPQYQKAQQFENLVFRFTFLKYHKCIMKKMEVTMFDESLCILNDVIKIGLWSFILSEDLLTATKEDNGWFY